MPPSRLIAERVPRPVPIRGSSPSAISSSRNVGLSAPRRRSCTLSYSFAYVNDSVVVGREPRTGPPPRRNCRVSVTRPPLVSSVNAGSSVCHDWPVSVEIVTGTEKIRLLEIEANAFVERGISRQHARRPRAAEEVHVPPVDLHARLLLGPVADAEIHLLVFAFGHRDPRGNLRRVSPP